MESRSKRDVFEEGLIQVMCLTIEVRDALALYNSAAEYWDTLQEYPKLQELPHGNLDDARLKMAAAADDLRRCIADLQPLVEMAEVALGQVHAPLTVKSVKEPTWVEATCWPVWVLKVANLRRLTRRQCALKGVGPFGLTLLSPGYDIVDETLQDHLVQEFRAAMHKWDQEHGQRNPAPPQVPAIISYGEMVYSVPGGEPLVVTDEEDGILQSFLAIPAMSSKTLEDQSGVSRAPEVLRRLRDKYEGAFRPFIKLAGRKSNGGYVVRVCRA